MVRPEVRWEQVGRNLLELGEGEVVESAALAALEVLVSSLPPERRRGAMVRIIDSVDASLADAGPIEGSLDAGPP